MTEEFNSAALGLRGIGSFSIGYANHPSSSLPEHDQVATTLLISQYGPVVAPGEDGSNRLAIHPIGIRGVLAARYPEASLPVHAQVASQPSTTQNHVVSASYASSGQEVSLVTISQIHLFQPTSAAHDQIASPVTLSAIHSVQPAQAYHIQLADFAHIGLQNQGHLFATLEYSDGVSTVTRRVSNETIDGGTYLWENKIITIPTVSYRAAVQGGFVKVSWGAITFTPDVFLNSSGNLMTPPNTLTFTARWGVIDDAASSFLAFAGEGKLRQLTDEGYVYDLYEQQFPQLALAEGIGIQSTREIATITFPTADTMLITTTQSHDFLADDDVYLQEENNSQTSPISGRYTITVINSTTSFTISAPAHGQSSYTAASDPLEVSNEIVPRPIAIGQVTHMLPVRTGHSFESRYFRPNLMGTVDNDGEVSLASATMVKQSGTGPFTVRCTLSTGTCHFATNDKIRIGRAPNFTGNYTVTAVDAGFTWFEFLSDYDPGTAPGETLPALDPTTQLGAYAEYDYHQQVSAGVGYKVETYDRTIELAGTWAGGGQQWETDATANEYWIRSVGGSFYQTSEPLSCHGVAHTPRPTGLSNPTTTTFQTLADLFTWGADQLGLTLTSHGTPSGVYIDYVQYDQIKVVDLLDRIAGYANFSFYISGTELILIDNNTSKGQAGTLDDFEVLRAEIFRNFPIKAMDGVYKTHEKALGVTASGSDSAPYLREISVRVTRDTGEANGETREQEAFNQTKPRVAARISSLLTEYQKAGISVNIPLTRLSSIGEEFTFDDTFAQPARTITARVRELEYDFENDEIRITGYGTVADL